MVNIHELQTAWGKRPTSNTERHWGISHNKTFQDKMFL